MDAIPLSEQYRINIKNAIELIDNTLELVEKSNVVLSGKHLREIRNSTAIWYGNLSRKWLNVVGFYS